MAAFFSALDIKISLLVFAAFAINLVVTKFVVAYNVKTRAAYNDEEDNISAIIVDNIINYETVKLFANEDYENERLKQAFGPWKRRLWGYANSFRALDISVGSLVNISIFLVLFITLRLYDDATISLGDFVFVLGFVSSFFPQFFNLVFGFRDIAKNFADLDKYFSILDLKEKVKDPKEPKTLERISWGD